MKCGTQKSHLNGQFNIFVLLFLLVLNLKVKESEKEEDRKNPKYVSYDVGGLGNFLGV